MRSASKASRCLQNTLGQIWGGREVTGSLRKSLSIPNARASSSCILTPAPGLPQVRDPLSQLQRPAPVTRTDDWLLYRLAFPPLLPLSSLPHPPGLPPLFSPIHHPSIHWCIHPLSLHLCMSIHPRIRHGSTHPSVQPLYLSKVR